MPTCSGSRACLLTGQGGAGNGMLGLAHRGWKLNDYGHHLVHTLRRVGYRSSLVGEQHISIDPHTIGYDEVIPVDTTHANEVAPKAIDVMSRAQEPFFVSVGFFETHRSFRAPTSVRDSLYSLPPPNLPDTAATRRDMASFKASARSLDQGVGEVLNGLHELGLVENTLIICTTDHGLAFPGAKATLFDRGTGVMLIMRGPSGFVGGKLIDAMVTHLDIYPTICDLAGIEHPDWLEGRSLMPLVRAETLSLHDAVFSEMTYHAAYQPQRAVRTERWKYIRRFDDHERPVLANCDESASKQLLVDHGWAEQRLETEQLYDLVFDPGERDNVVAEPANAAVRDELRARLEAWMAECDDPLLQGPVAPPPGAEINDPSQTSPDDPTTTITAQADPTGATSR